MIGLCPNCGAEITWSPPMDTFVCWACGDRGHTEDLKPRTTYNLLSSDVDAWRDMA